jgi:hypothetical protein
MKHRKLLIASAAVVPGLALALSALGALAIDRPAAYQERDVTYVMGGLAKADADAIEHAAPYYPLQLEFLLRTKAKGEYLSNVKVRIKDATDKMVLDVTTDGPFLLARLPAGKYTVSAERDKVIKSRTVSIVPGSHRLETFEWQA